jgi:hypothetical protein
MGLLPILFCIFLVLKLIEVIDWSWWIVFAPLYPLAIVVGFFIAAVIFYPDDFRITHRGVRR